MGDYADALTEEMLSRSYLDPDYDPDEQPSRRRNPKNKMPQSDLMLTVSQVLELIPGEDGGEPTWINPGFQAVVNDIKSTRTKTKGTPMHICTLGDTTNPGIEISMTVFTQAPGFSIGDTIQVFGNGLRRTEYNGMDQVSVGRETEIHLLKRGKQGAAAAPAPTTQRPATATPATRPAPAGAEPRAYTPKGETVGMAINNAVAVIEHNAQFDGDSGHGIDLTKLQHGVEQIAALLIAASRRLEAGQVAAAEDVEV